MIDFRPRLLDTLKGYNQQRFAKDVGAGLTVGVVALPPVSYTHLTLPTKA